MSDKIGPLTLEKREGPVFLGMQSTHQREYSDQKAQEIDAEVKRIVDEAHQKALQVLKDNMQALHNLAKSLLEHETIDGEEVDMIISGASIEDIARRRAETKSKLEEEQGAFFLP